MNKINLTNKFFSDSGLFLNWADDNLGLDIWNKLRYKGFKHDEFFDLGVLCSKRLI